MQSPSSLPSSVQSDEELLDLLTRPSDALIDFIATLSTPLVVLGAGGKMGPTLCALARRAALEAGHALDVIAVSRFSNGAARKWLTDRGVRTIAADLLDRDAVNGLPDAENIINLTGLKFGTSQNPTLTWATNTLGPAFAAERFACSRIVALSTGNVYPLVPVAGPGATEDLSLTPVGEYANAAIARERLFEYFSQLNQTSVALIRLNFAVELRYGVLVDIARRVLAGTPIDVTNGWFNCIWQGDANEMILRSLQLAESPAKAWNLSHPDRQSVRVVAERFAELLECQARFSSTEAKDAFVCDPRRICEKLGAPSTPLDTVIEWTAGWIRRGGTDLNRSTSFEVRDGKY
jgi:uncharacterized protein YbjT (DUF2867 family)